ncbi:MAG: M67 family metallopeptidase [Alicyclobacillus macrosporangiidus]|nr:M67 family metallopeptidase [Alicyclobacillus macrosporangiidus]
MILHCMQELPYEACGLLSGKERMFQAVWKMENINRSPISFMMDTEQVRRVLACIEERGETLLGIYHSHPTAKPVPSAEDIAYCNFSDVAYFIVSFSCGRPEIGCFQISGNRAVPIEVSFR